MDPASALGYPATTWEKGGIGTHGGDAAYILSGISGYMDEFLVEYLRCCCSASITSPSNEG